MKGDAAYVSKTLDSIPGPVVLVGLSYGGTVISGAAIGKRNAKALVYVAGFAPDAGETAAALASKFPGGSSPRYRSVASATAQRSRAGASPSPIRR